jgi:carbon monoxide dehydrogenase subunit G
MELQGTRHLAITQQQAWDALTDPEVLKLCTPGCDKIEASGENQYSMAVSRKMGPLAANFAGKIAQVGQRLTDSVANSMAEDCFKRFDEAMQQRHPQAYAEKAVPAAPTAEGKPAGIPTWVWLAAGAALVAVYLALR